MQEQDTEEHEDTSGTSQQTEDEGAAYKQSLGLVNTSAFVTPEREKELWARRDSAVAKAEILESHLPLCKSLAAQAMRNSSSGKLSRDDYEAEAQLALVIAYDKYDPDNQWNARFCSYVAPRIKHALLDLTIRLSGPVKLATTQEQRSLFFNWSACNKIATIENPNATPYARQKRIAELLAERTSNKNIDVQTINDFENRMASRGVSLNTSISGGDDNNADTWQDFLVSDDGAADSNLEERDNSHTHAMMEAALTTLNERERDIITQRYLCEDGEKKHLLELADIYGVSAERIRQVEVKALKKMRAFMEGDVSPMDGRKAKAAQRQTMSLHP